MTDLLQKLEKRDRPTLRGYAGGVGSILYGCPNQCPAPGHEV